MNGMGMKMICVKAPKAVGAVLRLFVRRKKTAKTA